MTGSAGDAVDVNNRGGGTVTFGGPVSGTGGGVYLSNSITGSDPGIELDQDVATTIELPSYTGGHEDADAVESFLIGNNDGGGAVATVSGIGGGFVGVTGC